MKNFRPSGNCPLCPLPDGFTAHGGKVEMQQRRKDVQHRRDSPGFMQVVDRVRTCRTEFSDQRGFSAELIENIQSQVNSGFIGYCRKMQGGIGRSAQRQHYPDGILQAFSGQHGAGRDSLADEIHDPAPARPTQFLAGRVERGQGGTARQAESQRFGHAGHRAGSTHEVAGTRPGTGTGFNGIELLCGNPACLEFSHPLLDITRHDFPPADPAGSHWATGDEQGRQVQPGSGHQHARHDLVTITQHHQAVELVRPYHQFDRGCDDVTQGQDIVHAPPLGDPVAGCHGVKFSGRPTGFTDPLFDPLRQGPQMEMAGIDFVPGIDNADQGLAKVVVLKAHGPVQGPRIGPMQPVEESAFGCLHRPISCLSAWVSSTQGPTFQRPKTPMPPISSGPK